MKYSYKKTAAAVMVFTLILSALLIIIAYRGKNNAAASYTLKGYNGAVALYENEEVITVYEGVVLSGLPYSDRLKLDEGIKVKSPEEADSLIEDFDG